MDTGGKSNMHWPFVCTYMERNWRFFMVPVALEDGLNINTWNILRGDRLFKVKFIVEHERRDYISTFLERVLSRKHEGKDEELREIFELRHKER